MKIDSPTFLTETTFISASVQFSSGSQKFGNTTDDIHQFTGSVSFGGPVTASSNISGSISSTGSFGRVKLAGDIVISNNKYLYFEGDSDDAFNRIGKSSGENAVLMTSRFKAGVLIDSNNDDTDSF